MFGIGLGEMIVIGILLILAVGPDKIPSVLRTAARSYRQFRRAAVDIRQSTGIDDFLRDDELKELADLRKQKILAMGAGPKPLGKPGVPGKPGVELDKPGGVPEGAPMVVARRGLSAAQRVTEAPPEGVDLAEARHALAVARTAAAGAPAAAVPAAAVPSAPPVPAAPTTSQDPRR